MQWEIVLCLYARYHRLHVFFMAGIVFTNGICRYLHNTHTEIFHYLGKERRVELISSPSHTGSGASCHVTLKRQVASFLDLVLGGDNVHNGQTWEQQKTT